jgi:signal transduction histidine kinase
MDLDRAPAQAAAPPISRQAVLLRPWLSIARYGWLAAAGLILALFALSLPVYFEYLRTVCFDLTCAMAPTPPPGAQALRGAGLSPSSYAAYYVTVDVVVAIAYLSAAALIFQRRSTDGVALLGAFTLLIWGFFSVPMAFGAAAEVYPQWQRAYDSALFLGLVSITLFFYLFPDGRFAPRWSRWLALALILLLMPGYIWPDSLADYRRWPPLLAAALLLCWMGSMIGLQVYRYWRVSGPTERQQTKWVVFGVAGSFLSFFTFVTVPLLISPSFQQESSLLRNLITNTGGSISMLLLPVSIGVAILRHRLWDIDVVINRTLVYVTLTGIVVGLYVVIVGGLGTLLRIQDNPVLSLLATGVVAVAFAPLRDWLQRSVNRLIYGERDEPYRVLSRLGRHVEATLTPDSMLSAIVETVAQALRLPYVAITLRQDDRFVTAAEYGTGQHDLVELPLVYGSETVGQLRLAPRARGESFNPADWRLLEDLARQMGVAAHAVRLAVDLHRSNEHLRAAREGLVTAREEERRRLRRDLHDGLGPALASESLKVGAIRKLMTRDQSAADALLSELGDDIEATIADIRRLVYDLRPPALDELGLVGAIRERVAQLHAELHVVVEAPERRPTLPAAVEVAAYRITQEALTNVARHARAKLCLIRLGVDEGVLCLEVLDDGVGLAGDRKMGVGMFSMRERAEELGGTLAAETLPSGGTRILAQLPIGKE